MAENKLECWKCHHEWRYEMTGSYPCGPCPTGCPKCNESVCPKCGGELSRESENDEIRDYCGPNWKAKVDVLDIKDYEDGYSQEQNSSDTDQQPVD